MGLKKRILAAAVVFLMAAVLLLPASRTSMAAGTGGIEVGDAVRFGTFSNQTVLWQVVDESKMTLFSVGLLGQSQFASHSPDATSYNGGYLQSNMNTAASSLLNTMFTSTEKAAISATVLSDGNPTGDYLFPLSLDEFNALPGSVSTIATNTWWLRTSNGTPRYFYTVDSFGDIEFSEQDFTLNMRPAMNLDLSKVYFADDGTTPGTSGKAAADYGDPLTAISSGATSVWHLTLLDSSRTLTVDSVTRTGSDVTIDWSNASTGTGSYVSVAILNSAGEVQYYTKLANTQSTNSGTSTVTLPTGFDANNWRLEIFSEHTYNDWRTDYAGARTNINAYFDNGTGDVPQTGDTATPFLWLGLAVAACVGFVFTRRRHAK
jgi:LPXTG-motif cell wall-anchored protein